MRRPRPVLPAFVAALCASACGDTAAPTAPAPPPTPAANAADDAESERRFLAEIDRSRGVRDCFLPIRDPVLVPADGPHGLSDEEFVVGADLSAAGAPVQVAYPVQYLNFHEIVEHRVASPASADGVEGASGPLHLLACW